MTAVVDAVDPADAVGPADAVDPADVAFIRATTVLASPPGVPELRLYLGGDVTGVWERTEARAGLEQPPPFWAFAWAGGQALARYLLDHPATVAGRAVLDIACGGGVAAVAAALAGATPVMASDIDRLAVGATALNARANGVSVTPVLADVLDGDGAGAEVVLAGDVCYSREMTARVVGFLDRAMARGATVLLGDPGRAYLPIDRFVAVASYEIPVSRDLESVEIKRTTIWRPA